MTITHHTTVSRADLVWLIASNKDASHEALFALAGYERKEPFKLPAAPDSPLMPVTQRQPAPPAETKDTDAKTPVHQKFARKRLSATFFKPVSCEFMEKKPQGKTEPEWYIKARPLEPDEIKSQNFSKKLPWQPLTPWANLWPFLKSVLSQSQSLGKTDIKMAVELAAKLKPIHRIPKERRLTWASRCTLLVDVHFSLLPFWRDFGWLKDHLFKLRGKNGFTLYLTEQNPYETLQKVDDSGKTICEFSLPEPGTPLVIIGDIGLLDPTGKSRALWLSFGRHLKRFGFQPVVMTPLPESMWSLEQTSVFNMVCWDRGKRLPIFKGKGTKRISPLIKAENKNTALTDLFTLLSPAIRVEPELLRMMRMTLSSQIVNAGDEAAFWSHPDIQAGMTGCSFRPERVEALRERFVSSPLAKDLKKKSCEMIRKFHCHLSPAVVAEEEMVARLLLSDVCAEEAEDFFKRCVKTHARKDFSEWEGLNAWMHRVMTRCDQRLWKSDALSAMWGKVNKKGWEKGKIALPKGMDPERISWILAKEENVSSYTLYQVGLHWIALNKERKAHTGSPICEFTSSNGVLKVMGDDSNEIKGYVINLNATNQVPLEIPEQGRVQIATTHHKITLESFKKPEWAEGIGRDEKGLFVTIPDGEGGENQRKAYWFAPGRYPAAFYYAEGKTNNIQVKNGFWWDEKGFDEIFENGFEKPEWADDFGKDAYGIYATFQVRGVIQKMRWIWPGNFMMGSPENEPDRLDDETQHEVILTQGFWMGETACTQSLWQAVMGNNPSRFKGDSNPVDNVSWKDCQQFFEKINGEIPGLDLKLPTEAQWERACRAETTTPFHFGEDITTDQVNFDGRSPYNNGLKGEYREKTVPVMSFPCNPWGLYEMHGNVIEWCADWYGDYPSGEVVDPLGPSKGETLVLRGGSWSSEGRVVRSANRYGYGPGDRDYSTGFRVSRGQTGSAGKPGSKARKSRQGRYENDKSGSKRGFKILDAFKKGGKK